MRNRLLISMTLTGLAVLFLQPTVAAPLAASAIPIAVQRPSLEQVYYSHGRYYPYHHNNRYYAHRVYHGGHWRYY